MRNLLELGGAFHTERDAIRHAKLGVKCGLPPPFAVPSLDCAFPVAGEVHKGARGADQEGEAAVSPR